MSCVQAQPTPQPVGAANQVGAQASRETHAPQGNGASGEAHDHHQPLDGASEEEWKALDKVTRERDQLQTNQQNKRRRSRHVDEPTPEDPKYNKAGKRCALMYLLWISSNLFETEIDATYSKARRYDENESSMQVQGDLQDVLASAPWLREDLLHKMINSINEQRRNSAVRARKGCGSAIFGFLQADIDNDEQRAENQDFRKLLGYQPSRPLGRRYCTLPPLLYDVEVGPARENDHLFRNEYLIKLFKACAFGPLSVLNPSPSKDFWGQQILAKKLGLKSITPGAIAFSTILSGIKYKVDYEYYKMLIIEGIRHEREVLEENGIHGPFLRLINEWNRELFPNQGGNGDDLQSNGDPPSDVEDAMAQIRQFGRERH
ncbi:hypothetical protein BDV93DRAFT_559494 [Ceratobasidium sp. AG-I]|nr:hypothetical protein BDV93DRAFT_559494 [Ceratobasidium sp. AG-I]